MIAGTLYIVGFCATLAWLVRDASKRNVKISEGHWMVCFMWPVSWLVALFVKLFDVLDPPEKEND